MKNKDMPIIKQDADKESRRDFLKTASKVALYTPPAIMMLMQPNRDALACTSLPHRRRRRRRRRRR